MISVHEFSHLWLAWVTTRNNLFMTKKLWDDKLSKFQYWQRKKKTKYWMTLFQSQFTEGISFRTIGNFQINIAQSILAPGYFKNVEKENKNLSLWKLQKYKLKSLADRNASKKDLRKNILFCGKNLLILYFE